MLKHIENGAEKDRIFEAASLYIDIKCAEPRPLELISCEGRVEIDIFSFPFGKVHGIIFSILKEVVAKKGWICKRGGRWVRRTERRKAFDSEDVIRQAIADLLDNPKESTIVEFSGSDIEKVTAVLLLAASIMWNPNGEFYIWSEKSGMLIKLDHDHGFVCEATNIADLLSLQVLATRSDDGLR